MTATDNEWRVEITTGSGTLTPPVAADVEFQPGINDIPRARVPVPASDRYAQDIGPGADAELYYRSDKLPIDRLVSIDRESSEQTDTLVLEGGLDLTDYRDQIVLTSGLASDVVADVLADSAIQTDINQYAPSGTKQTTTEYSVPVADINVTNEFTPVTDAGDPAQVAFTVEGENIDRLGTVQSSAFASADDVAVLDDTGSDSFSFTVEYTIPVAKLAVRIKRQTNTTDNNKPVEIRLDGDPVGSFANIHTDSVSFDWYILGEAPNSSWTGPTIEPGDHTLTLDIPFGSDNKRHLDVVSLFDDRARPALTFDNGVDINNPRVDGPELYPDAGNAPAGSVLSIRTEEVRSLRPVASATVEVTTDTAQSGYTAELTTDAGQTFRQAVANSTTSLTAIDFDPAPAGIVLPRYGLAGDDSGSGTPATGNQPVAFNDMTVTVTTEDRRTIRAQETRGELIEVLQRLAETADAVFEIGVDSAGNQTLRWDYPEENRSVQQVDIVESVSATTANDDQAERVRVFGSSTEFEETVTFPGEDGRNSAAGRVGLDGAYLISSSVTVTRADTGTELTQGVDYELRGEQDPAELVALGAGPTEIRPDVTVTAPAKIYGEAALDGVADPTTVEISGLSLQEDFAAQQAARIALADLSDPRREADVTLSEFDPRDSLLDPLTAPEIPFEPERVTSVSVEAGSVSVGLASRATAADVIASLRQRSKELARAV